MYIIQITLGLVILFIGGEILIKGSISIARHLNISRILVSSIIIGFGTSMPEMTVSVSAMFEGSPEIAIGNAIGSNIANILFILGVCALVSPFYLRDKMIKRDVIVMVISTLILFIFGILGVLSFIHGVIMISLLASYIVYSYLEDKKYFSNKDKDTDNIESDMGFVKNANLFLSIIIAISGIILLIIGSSLFLNGSISIANIFNIDKEIIGLGIVAIGSCLPELTTATVASFRKQGDIVIASIVGSNIFNILSIVGVISLIDAIKIPIHILQYDLWVLLASTLILSFMLLRGVKFSRVVGGLFLTTYILYFYTLFSS